MRLTYTVFLIFRLFTNLVTQKDGVEIDKIVLTLNQEYDLSKMNKGTGPSGNNGRSKCPTFTIKHLNGFAEIFIPFDI